MERSDLIYLIRFVIRFIDFSYQGNSLEARSVNPWAPSGHMLSSQNVIFSRIKDHFVMQDVIQYHRRGHMSILFQSHDTIQEVICLSYSILVYSILLTFFRVNRALKAAVIKTRKRSAKRNGTEQSRNRERNVSGKLRKVPALKSK